SNGSRARGERLGASSRGSGCDCGEIRRTRRRRGTRIQKTVVVDDVVEKMPMKSEEKERRWRKVARILWRIIVRGVRIGVHTVAVSLVVLIIASGMSSFPRTSPLLSGVSRNQQLAVLAALGSVSLVALYVWYQKKQDKAKKMARSAQQQQAAATTAAAAKEESEQSQQPLQRVEEVEERAQEEHHHQQQQQEEVVVKRAEEKEEEGEEKEKVMVKTGAPVLLAAATVVAPAPAPAAAVAAAAAKPEEPEAQQKKESVVVERDETSSNASDDLSDTDSHSKSSGRSDADFEIEPATLETGGVLKLEVCENFSWAEDVERSYSEAMANEQEEERARLEAGYEGAESPGLDSQGSEDSGRATGGLASSLSPMDNSATTTPNGTMFDANPMYEFEIPNSLVGLIIGVKGKTIKELSMRTDVRMLIRAHHETGKVDTHQICQVRGKRDKINRCLQMLRKRFPPARFPELNLQPVLPPALPTNLADLLNAQPSWLTLPESVACEAAVAHLIDAGHLFIQQPTHPSYSSLALLDQYMIRLYSKSEGIPEVPHPCETGLLCAAPVMQAWFRAVIVMYFAEEDEALVRFVDYGGYARIARAQLRQIRTDLMTLPFQATECFLAHVQPVDGTSQWSSQATEYLRDLVSGKVVDVTLIGYSVDERIPVVEIDVIDETEGTRQRVDRLMINAGFAKAADPSKVARIQRLAADKKPVLSQQSSYTTSGSTIMAF
ncbi:hypothetical protein PENTCL1PPCAC_10187, partial [Pristionchus entomophagus]